MGYTEVGIYFPTGLPSMEEIIYEMQLHAMMSVSCRIMVRPVKPEKRHILLQTGFKEKFFTSYMISLENEHPLELRIVRSEQSQQICRIQGLYQSKPAYTSASLVLVLYKLGGEKKELNIPLYAYLPYHEATKDSEFCDFIIKP